jgi:hypothetical protein
MSRGKNLVTNSFLRKYNQDIERIVKLKEEYDAKLIDITDRARAELGYSDMSANRDIFGSIWTAFRKLKERD